MKPSTHDLIAYLEQNELKYAQRSDDEDIVMLGFTTQRASLSLMFICEKRSVQLLCRLPFRAQPEQFDVVKDYFTRINYAIKIGCFELDVRDGEMNMRSATFLSEERLGAEQAALLLLTVTRTVDDYISGLQDVLFRQVAPSAAANDALAQLEAQERDPDGMLDVYSRISSIYPSDLFARYKEGSLLIEKGQGEAVKAAAEAMIKAPSFWRSYNQFSI